MRNEMRIDIHIHPERILSDKRWDREQKIEMILANQVKGILLAVDETCGEKRIELFDYDANNQAVVIGELLINQAC